MPPTAIPTRLPVGLLNGLKLALEMLVDEGLENVFARHHRIAEGVRRAIAAWGMTPNAASPDLYSDTVTAIVAPEGFNGTDIVTHAAKTYGVAFGVGLGEVAGKVFRIGHLGSLTDVMMLSRSRHGGNGDGRSGLSDQAGLWRCGGTGLLS